jgi:hypothetical protein
MTMISYVLNGGDAVDGWNQPNIVARLSPGG